MEFFKHKGFLRAAIPLFQTQRFRGKINIQRPRAPHYERAKLIALTRPIFPKKVINPIERCILERQPRKKETVDNPYQAIIAKDCRNWFDQSKMVAIFHLNPMTSEDQFKLEVVLRKNNMYSKRYGKAILKMAFEGTGYGACLPFFESQTLIVFSAETQVQKILKIVKKKNQLILLGGIIEGRLLHKDGFVQYGNLPDLQTARASLAQVLKSGASQITSHLNQHQNTLVQHLESHMKQCQESEPVVKE